MQWACLVANRKHINQGHRVVHQQTIALNGVFTGHQGKRHPVASNYNDPFAFSAHPVRSCVNDVILMCGANPNLDR